MFRVHVVKYYSVLAYVYCMNQYYPASALGACCSKRELLLSSRSIRSEKEPKRKKGKTKVHSLGEFSSGSKLSNSLSRFPISWSSALPHTPITSWQQVLINLFLAATSLPIPMYYPKGKDDAVGGRETTSCSLTKGHSIWSNTSCSHLLTNVHTSRDKK